MKNSGHVVGPLTLMALSCIWFTIPVALSDELHHRPVPAAESAIQPALPSAGYILTRARGRAMVRRGFMPCQPRGCNNLTPGTIAVQAGNTAAVVQDNAAAAPHVEDPELRALLEARRDTMKELVRIKESASEVGAGSVREVAVANIALAEAELELARSKDQRIAILEQLLERQRELEQVQQAMRDSGAGQHEDFFAAKAARLKAEIELHKARNAE